MGTMSGEKLASCLLIENYHYETIHLFRDSPFCSIVQR